MRRSYERSGIREHSFAADGVFDALGFSGEPTGYDEVNALIEASKFLAGPDASEASRTEVNQWLLSIRRCTERHKGYSDDKKASMMLGYVIGRKVGVPPYTLTQAEQQALVARTLQNVHLSQVNFGHGDVESCHGAFLDVACTYAQSADPSELEHLRQMVTYASICRRRLNSKQEAVVEVRRASLWPNIVRGLASIAMIQGYNVIPPPDQTDKDGAWDPGHEDDLGEAL